MTTREKLIEAAWDASANSYSPYSNFSVGAALLLDDGEIVTGTNIENASYGLALCAEAVVLGKANSEGKLRQVVEIGIVGGLRDKAGKITGDAPVRPCGRCRQMLNEAAQLGKRDIQVHCASADGSVIETHALSALLPHAFGPGDLGIT